MARSLELIVAELAVALESRTAFDPDSPPWAGTARIRQLEEELVAAWRSVSEEADRLTVDSEPLLGIPV